MKHVALKSVDFRVMHCANHDRNLLILSVMGTTVADSFSFFNNFTGKAKKDQNVELVSKVTLSSRQTKLDQKTPLDYLLFQMSNAMFESLTNTRETNKERGKERQKNLNMLKIWMMAESGQEVSGCMPEFLSVIH